MNSEIRRILEMDVVLEKVASLAVSVPGREIIHQMEMITDRDRLATRLSLVTELRNVLEYDDPFPLWTFPDIRPLLNRIQVQGACLQPEELNAVKNALSMVRHLDSYMAQRADKYPLLKKSMKDLKPFPELEEAIDRVIDENSEVRDKASATLAGLRRDIGRKTASVRKRLDSIMRDLSSRGWTMEDSLVIREGRLAIPLKENYRGAVKGVILDQSSSGATVFIEPLDVLELNNDIRRLRLQEKQEIERILVQITEAAGKHVEAIATDVHVMGQTDGLLATVKFALRIQGETAQIAEDGYFYLNDARHPLLLGKLSRDEVIPLTLEMDAPLRTLIITGPNAGGKTVALKTIGLLALMHQHGLPIPASSESRLPLFSDIFADIGDRQSIEQDLSTFSSHMQSLKTILENARGTTLVLLDEIGSATDPAEGAALAMAVLKHLTVTGAMTVATTHMGSLKVFAHEEPGMENGSMVFDQESLEPTYRFCMGIPGSSYAFEIAERLGLAAAIIEDARSRIGDERGQLDRLILHLEDQVRSSQELRRDAEIKESRLSGLIKLYDDRLNDLNSREDQSKQKALDEAESILREANTLVERVVRDIREQDASRESIQSAREAIRFEKNRIQQMKPKKKKETVVSLHKGDWVLWGEHPGRGKMISDADGSGRVLVEWEHARLRIPLTALKPAGKPDKKAGNVSAQVIYKKKKVRDEIDLRGMTVDEALDVLETYLGDATASGFKQVRIIHGKGTGALRNAVGKYLKKHARVETMRLGGYFEGDTGVTILELK